MNVGISFREREVIDLGCQIYLIKRTYAEKLVSHYLKDQDFVLDVPLVYIKQGSEKVCNITCNVDTHEWQSYNMFPIVENVMYLGLGKTYICPLFIEDIINTNSTYSTIVDDCHKKSYEYIIQYWKDYGQNMNIKDFFIGVTK